MLYHVSSTSNLKILVPRISTHGKAYVYAIENVVTAMLFGAKHSDFDFIIDTRNDGRPRLSECYEGGFERIFKDKTCSIYTVDRNGFKKGITGWSPEYVSENRVRILKEDHVRDLHNRLMLEEEQGNLSIRTFEDTSEYKTEIENHIKDRLIRFNIVNSNCIDPMILSRYGYLIDEIRRSKKG